MDETGLEVGTYRHRIAQKAINMFHGDLFWYSMFLIKEFMVQKTKFYFVDVCVNSESLLEKGHQIFKSKSSLHFLSCMPSFMHLIVRYLFLLII